MISTLDSPRRLAVAALVALTTLGLLASSVGSAAAIPARQSDTAGAGAGIAELVQIDPAIANLSLTIRVGTSLAGHQNIGATSEARTLDLGFIGSILTGEGCNGGDPTIPPSAIPEIISANSSDPEDADG
ncbi:MAG: hypothetical protein OSA99_15910, partial [Acidimicrobiales bacterium]|nr:hypothetical protein [Acidimicrobiales bacterium]